MPYRFEKLLTFNPRRLRALPSVLRAVACFRGGKARTEPWYGEWVSLLFKYGFDKDPFSFMEEANDVDSSGSTGEVGEPPRQS
jgi:hypothetical protein